MHIVLSILIWILTGLFFAAGLAGSLIPNLPGPPLIFVGVLIHALLTGFAETGWLVLLVVFALAALSQILDYAATAYGAKKFGGSAGAMWGSVAGGIVGALIFSIPGLLIGIFMGAVIMDFLRNRNTRQALKVGGGSLLGLLGGTLMKIIVSLAMIGIFLFDIIS